MSFLLGDVTGSGRVGSTDLRRTKSQEGQAVTVSNFRKDMNSNGHIGSTDISLVKAQSGTALPTSP